MSWIDLQEKLVAFLTEPNTHLAQESEKPKPIR